MSFSCYCTSWHESVNLTAVKVAALGLGTVQSVSADASVPSTAPNIICNHQKSASNLVVSLLLRQMDSIEEQHMKTFWLNCVLRWTHPHTGVRLLAVLYTLKTHFEYLVRSYWTLKKIMSKRKSFIKFWTKHFKNIFPIPNIIYTLYCTTCKDYIIHLHT